MPESDAPNGTEGRNAEHELWLAMQAAFNHYRNASAALDAVSPLPPGPDDLEDESIPVERLAAEQRAAFESYIEARMQLAEFLRDRREPAPPGDDEDTDRWSRTASAMFRQAPLAVAVALLCTTVFSLGSLGRERMRVRELEAARDGMTATMNQTRDAIQALVSKLDSLDAARRPAIREAAERPPAPVRPRLSSAPKRAVKPGTIGHWRRVGTQAPSQRQQGPSAGKRGYREFTLTPSRQFQRVGPVSLSLRTVDSKHQYFDLTLLVDGLQVDKKHVKLHEPIWIRLSGHAQPVELVANRIDGNRVQGYLAESRS
jgi:hypothetical protein